MICACSVVGTVSKLSVSLKGRAENIPVPVFCIRVKCQLEGMYCQETSIENQMCYGLNTRIQGILLQPVAVFWLEEAVCLGRLKSTELQ